MAHPYSTASPLRKALKHLSLSSISLIIAILLGFCSVAGAQRFAATVQRYGPEDGLAHREVNAILQDRRGFMWFGTKLGLCRFDGATFTTYTREKNGLDFDDIHSMAQDADGLLWLMGPSGQSNITLFDPITGVATSFEKRFHRSRPTHFFGVWQSLRSSNDGTIVFVDYQPARLNVYQSKTGLRTVSLPQYKSLSLVAVTARNTVWVSADHTQLVELTMDGRVLRTYDNPQLRGIYACVGQSNASAEVFYRYARSDDPLAPVDKLYKIDGAGHRQALSPALIESAKMQYPLAYAFNQHGLLWNGCQLRDSTGRVLLDITSQLPSGLIEDRSFFQDRTGSMWLGTSFGLYQIRVGRDYFQRLFYEPGEGKKPAARGITAVGKTLYTNLENVGLFSSTFSGESVRQLSVGEEVFNSMSDTLGGKLYLAQITKLVAYDYRTAKTTIMPTPAPGMMVWSIHRYSTKPNRLLAGGDPGLSLVDPIANKMLPFRGYNQFPELARAHILHIGTDRQGTIWLCATTGLYTIDPHRGVTARYWSGGRGVFRLPADSYQHFYQDPQGLFWLATANTGLIRWDRARNSYRQFRRADGLNNDNIYAVYPDRRGHLWLSSDEGIMQFDPVRLTTRTYTVQDGITNNEFNRIAHYQDAQGRLYFGGLNGVTAFDPRDFDAEPSQPALPLRVVSFRQFDDSRNTLVDKTAELLRTNQITLQPNDRNSIINFALLNYADARKNTYAYQFKGIEDSWHYQPEQYLRLSNLPYGDYQLLIKGQSADGRMSAATLAFEMHVLRPFYLRSWFLVLLIVLLLAGTWVWGGGATVDTSGHKFGCKARSTKPPEP
ncbi:ligand-binding sensor domain-containing protein [Spirosoma rhododendri]|uniref:ligand-binding sensor domain-containing protein n=1 Tax=Spirosoma rhododendri TaxID=2728024 RepID=UPI0020C22DEF|nr:two-component regulator propeller domain-containing protein [Spirosoma rhododendri]